MKVLLPKIGMVLLATLCAPRAEAMTQTEALAAAAAAQKSGSDSSLQNSTTNAMHALLDLNEQNRPSAVDHGYKAFGEYKTSQNLDADRIRSRIRQIDLFTSNLTVNSPVPNVPPAEDYRTTYSRLDPKFLRQGEAGKIADEFELKSGMPREVFLKKMAQASESTISADDPNLTAKVMKKFNHFVDDIPNEDFRNRVKEQIDQTSSASRTALILDGARHVFNVLAKKGISIGQQFAANLPTEPSDAARAPASAPDATYVPVTGEAPARAARAEDPQSFFQKMAPTDAPFRGLDYEKFNGDALGGIMQTALDEQRESTIFRQVSKRYRALTPLLKLTKE